MDVDGSRVDEGGKAEEDEPEESTLDAAEDMDSGLVETLVVPTMETLEVDEVFEYAAVPEAGDFVVEITLMVGVARLKKNSWIEF